jgi:hypothetical protein
MTIESDLETRWRNREAWWRRKLGRLRLGVEPLEEQVERYRRATWALTVVPAILAVMFLALFTAFGRPDIALLLIAILLLPIVVFAWIDQVLLAQRARRYLAELEEHRRASESESSRHTPRDLSSGGA